MDDTTPSQTTATAAARPVDDEISLWEVLAVLLRRRRTIFVTTILTGITAFAVAHFLPLKYSTSASFRPQGSEASSSQIMALASQFGVNVPGAGGDEASPAFYAEILTSREILARTAAEPYEVEGMGPVLLKDLLEIEEDTEAIRDQETIDWMREDAVSVGTGRETGTVNVTVTTEWPEVSREIAERLLAEVARFNLETRQSQAASERTFIQERVEEAEAHRDTAEDSLQAFLEANRQYDRSPLLIFRFEELSREVTLRSSVVTTLVQSLLQAEISEVRDTPVITVLQDPYLPPDNDPRRRVLSALIGLILGSMLGIVLAFVVDAFRRPSADDPARADFEEAWRSLPIVGGGRG